MIVKILSRKRPTYRQLLEYMLHNEGRLFNANKKSFVITHNLKGNTISAWEKQFKDNELCRKVKRKKRVFLNHEILSWHRNDATNLTLEKMEDMAREYINLRNPKGVYVAVPHFDKEHYHLHICSSGIEYKTGKSLRLSKAELYFLKKKIQDYQIERYPELTSIVQHGKKEKKRTSEKEYQYKLRTGRETDKSKVLAILNTAYKKATSKDVFFSLLNENETKIYLRSGKITGVVYNNRKYRFKRLGFTEELLEQLNRTLGKNKELQGLRGKDKEKRLSRNR